MRFRAQSDQRASVNVESAVPDQIFIDHRVEVAVVLDVIDVPVDVVVLPARTDAREMRVLCADTAMRRGAVHEALRVCNAVASIAFSSVQAQKTTRVDIFPGVADGKDRKGVVWGQSVAVGV